MSKEVENNYKVKEIELNIDGEVKTFVREKVRGRVFMDVIDFLAELTEFGAEKAKEIRRENPEMGEEEVEGLVEFATIREFNMVEKSAKLVVSAFEKVKPREPQFTEDELIDGIEPHELVAKLVFYTRGALSKGDKVNEETEDFLEKEQEAEKTEN